MTTSYGIDVSHHNFIDWVAVAPTCDFAICRATYGTVRDRKVITHMERARSLGIAVGAYHFFRPSQPRVAQLEAFCSTVRAAGYRVGDVIPALDVEFDPIPKPGAQVSPAWQEPVQWLLERMVERFGGAMVYITQAEFKGLGSPGWLLDYPLWVAHWRDLAKPASPGNKPHLIWQHRVGPYVPNGAAGYDKKNPLLDQNRAAGPLPRVTCLPWEAPAPAAATIEPDDDWDELCAAAMELQFDTMQIVRDEAYKYDLNGEENPRNSSEGSGEA